MQNLMPPINTPDQLFHDGDPTQGIEGTLVTAGYLNNQQGATRDLQQELLNVLGGAHIQPDPKKTDQLLTALRALLLSRKNPFGDIKLDGTVQKALENLGLGEGSALPVGVPVPWPSATPPTGWLKCNGAAFSAEEYPELAKAYPTNKLPDLRGEFIRGWDDGRGVDSSRGLLTSQDHLFASHGHWFDKYYALTGFDPTGGRFVVTADAFGELITANSISTVSVGGSETRPRNVAFNYIVRAA
ncbi:phage tail protein [Escherichia coli]|uniref:phage tail protein n=1 Tax=Escherichia coli TaxID=562 RepID=UPI0021B19529|nr:phage tail protein [Escherichia coli]